MTKLTPYQLKTATEYYRKWGRMRTKRLRKKYFANAFKYMKFKDLNQLFKWVYTDPMIQVLVYDDSPLYKAAMKQS